MAYKPGTGYGSPLHGSRRNLMGQDAAEIGKFAAGFVPIVGEGIDAYNAYDQFNKGNYGSAALNAGAAVAGAIPLFGDAAAGGLRTAAKTADMAGNVVLGGNALNKAITAAKNPMVQAKATSSALGSAGAYTATDDDEGWDTPSETPPPPPPSPTPTQIDQGSPASPQQQMVNQAPPQEAQRSIAKLSSGHPSMIVPENVQTNVAQSEHGGFNSGGSLGMGAAAALLPNPFLHNGPASAGFAPQLAGLGLNAPGATGSTAVATTPEEVKQHQDARRDFTPGRHFETANPIASALGFGGWKEEGAEEVAERVNQSYAGEAQRQGVEQTQYATVIDDTPVYVASATDPNDDDGWDHYESAATGVDEILNRRTYSTEDVLKQAREGNARTAGRDSLTRQAEANRVIENNNNDDSSSGGK